MMTFNESKIKSTISQMFQQQREQLNLHNQVEEIHPQIQFRYNSLNICLGKQGSGKTTFMLTELIKLSELQDTPYDKIVYITNGQTDDLTFSLLKQLVKIPILGLEFNDATRELSNYFNDRSDTTHHTFVIIEDASFLLMKDNPIWTDWVCKLRHLRMTIWINLHVWKSISTMIKTQITSIFIFKGFSREQMQHIYRQSCIDMNFQNIWCLYSMLRQRELLKITNLDGSTVIIK